MPIKPLTPAVRETADAAIVKPDERYTYGVWLPTDEQPGVIQVDAWPGPLDGINIYSYQISSGAAVYSHSSIGSTLNFLGIQGCTDKRPDKHLRSTQYFFPTAGQLAARAAILNETLPPEHQLPDFEPYGGGEYPARTFLEALAKGKVLVATSKRPDGQLENPYSAAHDMAFHVPYWLATTPNIRERLSRKAQQALETTTDEDTHGLPRNHPAHKAMSDIDTGISAIGMYGIVMDDKRHRRINPRFAEAIEIPQQRVYAQVQEVREHIRFLDQHISSVHTNS